MEDKTPGFKIFGQEFYYPNTWQGTVAISISAISLCVCLAIIYIWADDQGRAHVEKIISQTRYNADGTVSSLANIKQIQFWSPSPTTYKDTNISELPENRRWQKEGADDTKISKFSKQLSAYSSAWRHYEVYGTGKTGPKYGYWWVVTVNEDFDMKKFVLFYSDFWGSKGTLYIETPTLHSEYKRPKS